MIKWNQGVFIMDEQQLRYLIERDYGSVRRFSQDIGMPASTINTILKRGIINSNLNNVLKITNALGLKIDVFFPDMNDTESPIQVIFNQLTKERQTTTLDFATSLLEEQERQNNISIFTKYSRSEKRKNITDYVEGLVAAGDGIYQDENLHMEVSLDANKIPEKYDTIAKVAGNSMEPLINDNDLLFIKAVNQIELNDIGIFQVNGRNLVKQLKRDYNGQWYLKSLNNNYEEIKLSENDEIRTIGLVIDIYKDD